MPIPNGQFNIPTLETQDEKPFRVDLNALRSFADSAEQERPPAPGAVRPELPAAPDEKPRSTAEHAAAIFGIARDEKVSIAEAEQSLRQRDQQGRQVKFAERISTILADVDQQMATPPVNPTLYLARQIDGLQRYPGLSEGERQEAEQQLRTRFGRPAEEPPSFWREQVNRAARGMAYVGAGVMSAQRDPYIPPQARKYIKPEETAAYNANIEEQAKLLWEISQSPELAPQRDDLLSKVIGMGVETIPYITATTAATLVAGPFGGFAVGYMVEGNGAYRRALEAGVPDETARKIGFGVGVISGAIESFGGRGSDRLMKLATDKITNKLVRGAADLTVGSLTEALEEAGQELAAIGGESTYRDVNWNEGVRRTLTAAGGGALVGGMFKTGSAAVRGVTREKSAEQRPANAPPYEGEGPAPARPTTWTNPLTLDESTLPITETETTQQQREALVRQHGQLFRAWEQERDAGKQDRLAREIWSVNQKIDAIDGVDRADARPFVPPEVRAARAKIAALREQWARRGEPRAMPDYVSLEPEETERNILRPQRPALPPQRTAEELRTREQEEALYDTLMARAEAGDTAALAQLNDLVQKTQEPTYEELLARAQAGDVDAVQAIQEGRYRAVGTPRTESPARQREQLLERAEAGDDAAWERFNRLNGVQAEVLPPETATVRDLGREEEELAAAERENAAEVILTVGPNGELVETPVTSKEAARGPTEPVPAVAPGAAAAAEGVREGGEPATTPGEPTAVAGGTEAVAAKEPKVEQAGKGEVFYRGTVPGETQRIDEPFEAAKGKTFVARKEKSARAYGESIERIEAKPDAKILHEEDSQFWKLVGRKRPPNGYIGSALRKGETMVDAVNDAIRKAENAGYDIISFGNDSDIGTIILNENAVIRNVPSATPSPAAEAGEKKAWEMTARDYSDYYHAHYATEQPRVGNFPALAHKNEVRMAVERGDLSPAQAVQLHKKTYPDLESWKEYKEAVEREKLAPITKPAIGEFARTIGTPTQMLPQDIEVAKDRIKYLEDKIAKGYGEYSDQDELAKAQRRLKKLEKQLTESQPTQPAPTATPEVVKQSLSTEPAPAERPDPTLMADADMLRELRANYVRADRRGITQDEEADLRARNEDLREELLARGQEAKEVKDVERGKKAAPMDAQAMQKEIAEIEKTYGDTQTFGFKSHDDLLARYEKEGNHKKGESLTEFLRRIGCIGKEAA